MQSSSGSHRAVPDSPLRAKAPTSDHSGRLNWWLTKVSHQHWLHHQALTLLTFFHRTLTADGWFVELDDFGEPMPTGCPPAERPRENLLTVTRAVHSFAIGELLGVPGCRHIVDSGLDALWERYREPGCRGYVTAVSRSGVVDATRSTYGHAFVLLASSTALAAGHSAARQILDDVLEVVDHYLWRDSEGAAAEDFDGHWRERSAYRGANSNMHLCEAFLAAANVTGDAGLVERASAITDRLINVQARAHEWLLPEHYDHSWEPQLNFNWNLVDDPFRPFGATVGHLLEWSKLTLSVAVARNQLDDSWYLSAAESLFHRALEVGWDQLEEGLAYTVAWDGSVVNADHYWWPIAEGICASSYLLRATGAGVYELWYRRFWDYAVRVLIDANRGGWFAMFDNHNRRKSGPWYGKPDIYHALQACVTPLYGLASSLAQALLDV